MALHDHLTKAVHNMASKSKTPKHKHSVKRMTIEKGASGGYSVEHSMDCDNVDCYPRGETHVVGSHAQLVKHIKEHMPEADSDGDEY